MADHTTGPVTHLGCGATGARYATDTNLATVVTGATHTVTQPNDHAAQAHTVTGANPVVSATPTKVDEDTITLDVNTVLGDILYLTYITSGARLRTA